MESTKEILDIFDNQPDKPFLGSLISTIKSLVILGGVYTVMMKVGIFPELSSSLAFDFLYLTFILFLIFLAKNYQSQAQKYQSQAELCNSQIAFAYDDNGVLWHGIESNIALRVVTFREILGSIARNISDNPTRINAFIETGRNAGSKFGQQFKELIYPKELKENNVHFNDLDKNKRLSLWTKYDSSTGWGRIKAERSTGGGFYITAVHPTLFKKNGESWFSYLMAGYAEAVVNEITKDLKVTYAFNLEREIINDDGQISFFLDPV